MGLSDYQAIYVAEVPVYVPWHNHCVPDIHKGKCISTQDAGQVSCD